MDEITISLDDSPIISQPSPVLIGDQPPVVVQENFVGGRSATIQIGTVETLPAGSEAYVQNVGTETDAIFNFGIPEGERGLSGNDGEDGSDGQAATIQIGTVSTGLPDTNASVTNVGTSSAAVLDFTIPRGSQGERGLQGVAGEDGVSPIAYVTQTSTGATIHIEDAQNVTDAVITNGTDGTDGTDGFSPIATVTQTASGATVSITDAQGTTTANITNGVDGTDGTDGVTPSITASASVNSTTGTPAVTVTKSGTDTNPNFDFAFSGLKGETPDISDRPIFQEGTRWASSWTIKYDNYKPQLLFFAWGNNTALVYRIWQYDPVIIARTGSGTLTMTNNTTNKTVTYTTSQTGVVSWIELSSSITT